MHQDEELRVNKTPRSPGDAGIYVHVTSRKFLNPAKPPSARSLTRREEQSLTPAAPRPTLQPHPERRVRTGRSATGASRWSLSGGVPLTSPCLACCRKNPAHFQECSHPGDADYKEEEPEEAERPECPYGTDCYRSGPG